ncbi:pentatricopeptide repeat-containing protein At4g38010-like [Pistacia vera]|uniref:pentatricopeptide repeat-containing protein At4g38010-like n=1 Tax=Pistacia vera TaxID=55513 RepID=UPI001262C2E8|nr:pentatricopeptide repeat-containing protein At4g38010-like [Pistacia vera]
MQYADAGLEPNVIALDSCASFCAIEMGIWIHDFKKRRGWDLDVIVGTALVDMYGRCRRIEEGLRLFQGMKEKIELTPNADIKGLALGKRGEEAVWVVLMKWSNKGIML